MASTELEKWHAYHIWCADYRPQHHQKCVCVCPLRRWFLFINSNPPEPRRMRILAIAISAHEAMFLRHESYVHPSPRKFPEDGRIEESLRDERNHLGAIAPSLIARLKQMVEDNPTLTEQEKAIILNDALTPLDD